jgi:hypothetical protein
MNKTVYDWAVDFLIEGIAVIPVSYKTKIPKFHWEKYKTELPGEDEIYTWFALGNLHNYGVVVGWNDLVVLDFDDIGKYYEWNLWTLEQPENSDADLAAKKAFRVTSNRGVHIYLRMKGVKTNSHIEGLDIKANGMVLGPGSTHPSGKIYTPDDERMVMPFVDGLNTVLPSSWVDDIKSGSESENIETQYDNFSLYSSDPFDVVSYAVNPISKIKSKFRLQSMLNGVVRTGEHWYMALCPFHGDKNPSFWIDDRKQIGNCQKCNFNKPLDVINIYAKMHSLSDDQAIKILANM